MLVINPPFLSEVDMFGLLKKKKISHVESDLVQGDGFELLDLQGHVHRQWHMYLISMIIIYIPLACNKDYYKTWWWFSH